MTSWVVDRPGRDVPMHFTAFRSDYKLRDRPRTPPDTLARARSITISNGVRYACTGNVHVRVGASTYCGGCGELVVERDWYEIGAYNLTDDGRCRSCDTPMPGRFAGPPGSQDRTRQPVRLAPLRH